MRSSTVSSKSQIPLRYLVADTPEAGRRPASSCSLAASELDDRPNSSSLQVRDQLRTCLRPDSVMDFGFKLANADSEDPNSLAILLSLMFLCD